MEQKDWSEYRPKTFNLVQGWIRNWFSNFTTSVILIDGIKWPSVENYYQAMKCANREEVLTFVNLTPSQAKHKGRRVAVVPYWDSIKFDVMERALRVKFSQPRWQEKLLETGDEQIIEWNNWGDRIWGVDSKTCKGSNMLGVLLMKIRDEYKTDLVLPKDKNSSDSL
jgi:ribA/ribD-fused uncharacterized protein